MLLSNEKKSTTGILPFAIEIQNPNEILLISNEMKKQTKEAVMMFHLVLRLFRIKPFSFVLINSIENSMI
jgi:hypothetical protein